MVNPSVVLYRRLVVNNGSDAIVKNANVIADVGIRLQIEGEQKDLAGIAQTFFRLCPPLFLHRTITSA